MTADIHVVDEDIDAQGTGKLRAYEAISIFDSVDELLERPGLLQSLDS